MLTEEELSSLQIAARRIQPTRSVYLATDVVSSLLETVVDYQMHTTAVQRAIAHFKETRGDEIKTFDDLQQVFDQFPDDREGNEALAWHLWGYRLWTRAAQLRGLVSFFESQGVTDLEALRRWAETSSFDDFAGRVPGLGPVVYQWLVMRLGVDTVKPDVHVMRFVQETIGRPVSETDAVEGLREVASRLDMKASLLDWSIWEHQRSTGDARDSTRPMPSGRIGR